LGARGYFFHAVFHAWPDTKALDILQQIVPAMKRGYSKLIIGDIVLPEQRPSYIQATIDVQMMCLIAAHERTSAMWESLLTRAGFRIIK
jgi:fumagillin biosynthesis methyltransferase